MRTRLLLARWWVQGLVSGAFFAAYMTGFALLINDEGWVGALITGVLSGAWFGAFSAWWAIRERNRWRRSVGRGLSDAEQQIVHRASLIGPVPADPRLRDAAIRDATAGLERREGRRRKDWVTLVGLLVLTVVLGVTSSPWWFVMTLLLVYGGYETWSAPRAMRARIQVLSHEPEG
jgi:hypothetical protein